MKEIRADKRRYHYIYKITRFDCKYYIGMHSTNNLDDGYFGSGKLITRSIKKYGIEKHSKEILEYLDSRAALKMRERELVNEDIVNDALCMNLQLGGGGGFIDADHKNKCQRAGAEARGRQIKQFGQHPNSLKVLVESTKGRHYNWIGRNHREETKIKIGLANSIAQAGEKNSQFGTCWVTDGVKPVKIKKDRLDEYLADGYRKGRK
jgi:hypothetical protein